VNNTILTLIFKEEYENLNKRDCRSIVDAVPHPVIKISKAASLHSAHIFLASRRRIPTTISFSLFGLSYMSISGISGKTKLSKLDPAMGSGNYAEAGPVR
jgi:hypothetical protein